MPRGRPKRLGLSESDIEERRQRLYEFLPEDMREDFLEVIAASGRGGESYERLKELQAQKAEKKAAALEERMALIDRVVEGLKAHRKVLAGLCKDMRRGGDPGMIDLRQELKAPAIEGVMIRYLRSGTEGSGEAGGEGQGDVEGEGVAEVTGLEGSAISGFGRLPAVRTGGRGIGSATKAGTVKRRGRPKKMGFEDRVNGKGPEGEDEGHRGEGEGEGEAEERERVEAVE